MAFGSGLDQEDFQAPMAEINTTPLVDVMLVLLVIFMVTAPMLTQAITLELPSETASNITEDKAIVISIDSGGQYYWDNTAMTPIALDSHLQHAARENPKQPIHLRADKQTAYEKVSHILARAQKYGMVNIGFITQPGAASE